MPLSNAPQEGESDPRTTQPGLEARDPELYKILKAIPTRAEIDIQLNIRMDGYMTRLESVLKHEIKPVQEALVGISNKLALLEGEIAHTSKRVANLEDTSKDLQTQVLNVALQVVDLEDRSRRNNIRVRGVPDSISGTEITPLVKKICNHYLQQDEDSHIEFDRIHRVAGARGPNGSRPRDILVRIHKYKIKEAIMQAAWDRGPYEMGEARIILLQDVE